MSQVVELAVLHALRLGGVLDEAELASRLDTGVHEVAPVLTDLEAASLVTRSAGRLRGWSLTAIGRAHGEALLHREIEELGVRSQVLGAYEAFGILNSELLAVCTAWQVRSDSEQLELNDHSDGEYDSLVLRHLGNLHSRACELLDILEGALPRFSTYRPRLDKALQAALDGEVDWVTRPMIDSYHTVWFELHEDLLATIGVHRSDELRRRPPAGRRGRSITHERPHSEYGILDTDEGP